jgi:hypothetical protein
VGGKEKTEMIAIGCVYGGPEFQDSASTKTSRAVMNAVYDVRGNTYEDLTIPKVNVVYFFHGTLSTPEWTGLRDGTFSRKRKLLMIQVAVPEDLNDTQELEPFLLDSLRKANALALRVYHKKGLEYPLAQANELVDKVEQRLKEQKTST